MVDQFDYDAEHSIGFCESCIGGKHHRSQFEIIDHHSREPLKLVHSDVCYSWVYSLKSEDQVFDQFLELKAALVENSSGKRLQRYVQIMAVNMFTDLLFFFLFFHLHLLVSRFLLTFCIHNREQGNAFHPCTHHHLSMKFP